MNWRLIELESNDAAVNMAIDEAIYESVALEKQLSTIRFYKWLPSSVSIGAYQNISDVDLSACKDFGVQCVRRITGGRAVFHDKADFTYSVIAPLRIFNYSIENAYKQICSWIIEALLDIGINAGIKNKNDIIVNEKKISGNAAKVMNEIYLQHGTLVYNIDFDKMPNVLKVTPELVREKVTGILEHVNISQDSVYKKLRNSFIKGKNISNIGLSEYELNRAKSLAVTKYNKLISPNFSKQKGVCYVVHGD